MPFGAGFRAAGGATRPIGNYIEAASSSTWLQHDHPTIARTRSTVLKGPLMTTALTTHSLADIVPPMTAVEFAELKADIKAHGLLEPITLYEGKILDGKHRYRACRALNVPFKTRNWRSEDGSPSQYVISENVKRRHLSVGQKAALAVGLADELKEKFPSGKGNGADMRAIAGFLGTKETRTGATVLDVVAPAVGAATASAEVFRTLQKQAPRLAKQVAEGTMDLYAADDVRRRAARGTSPSSRPSPEKRAVLALQATANTAKQLRREIVNLEAFDTKLLEPNLMIALYHEVSHVVSSLFRQASQRSERRNVTLCHG